MEKKSNGGLVAIIVVLALLLCATSGYIIYTNMNKNTTNTTQNADNKNANDTKKSNIVISEDKAKELASTLITSDSEFGLYSDSKLTNEEANSLEIMTYGIDKYLIDNNIDYSKSF